jgi:hypothetical protein
MVLRRERIFADFTTASQNLAEGVELALNYELCWYELKQQYYGVRYNEDNSKIKGWGPIIISSK